MAQAQAGDKVRVHYTGRLEDGTVFDTSEGRDPLEFTIGGRQVISGFEEAVIGLELGESTTTDIPSHKAYGARDERMIMRVPRGQVPAHIDLSLNDRLQMRRPLARFQETVQVLTTKEEATPIAVCCLPPAKPLGTERSRPRERS